MSAGGESAVILTAVIGIRLLVPLLIWRYPLPGFLLAVFIDSIDEGLLRILGVGFSEEAYQSYDKALDIYFLAIAMLAMLRNWESRAAVQLGLFLFYYRLVGVVAFELSGWRALLVIFPNTFAPYFAFYELVRTWWQPSRLRVRHYLAAAALITVGFKLPHELWLHVLQLDVTELFREVVLRARYDERMGEVIAHVVLSSAALAAIPLAFFLIRKLAPAPAHPLRLAADPPPAPIRDTRQRHAWIASHWRLLDRRSLEKWLLIGLLTVIVGQALPAMTIPTLGLLLTATALVTLDSTLRLYAARRGWPATSPQAELVLLALVNLALALASHAALRGSPGTFFARDALLGVLLLTLLVTLYDAFRPIYEHRFARGDHARLGA
jgi:hypothetical protein